MTFSSALPILATNRAYIFQWFLRFWVSVTHGTRACILSKNVYSNLHTFPYWNHTFLFWSSPIVPRDWKIQGRTSSLPSIVPVNSFLNDRGRLLHICIFTITFLRAFNNSLSSVWLLDIPKYYSTQTNAKHPINQNGILGVPENPGFSRFLGFEVVWVISKKFASSCKVVAGWWKVVAK